MRSIHYGTHLFFRMKCPPYKKKKMDHWMTHLFYFLLLVLLIIQRRELQPFRHSRQNPLHSKNPLLPLQRFQPQRCCLRFQRFLQFCYRKKRKILQLRQQKQKLTSSFSLTFKLLNNLFPLKTLQRYTLFPIYSPYFASFSLHFCNALWTENWRQYQVIGDLNMTSSPS